MATGVVHPLQTSPASMEYALNTLTRKSRYDWPAAMGLNTSAPMMRRPRLLSVTWKEYASIGQPLPAGVPYGLPDPAQVGRHDSSSLTCTRAQPVKFQKSG